MFSQVKKLTEKESRASKSSKSLQDLAPQDSLLGREAWKKHILPIENFGTLLFRELFHLFPAYKNFFLKFEKSPEEDIFLDLQFRNHMNQRVYTKLKTIMEDLDKPEPLNALMRHVGVYHAKLGVTRVHIQNMQQSIINAIKAALDEKITREEVEAISHCFAYAFRIAMDAGEKYLKETQHRNRVAASTSDK